MLIGSFKSQQTGPSPPPGGLSPTPTPAALAPPTSLLPHPLFLVGWSRVPPRNPQRPGPNRRFA